ncbi:LysR family transcriptional regulator [Colwelliaceae bacterium BS250]
MNTIEGELSRIDLNLIVSLNVLLQERNVSRAAQRMYLSQSAMSRILQKLRDTFSDELFTRTSNGIVPTVKALELQQQLPDLLQQLHGLIKSQKFDPKTCAQTFSLAIPSLMSHALMLPFINSVAVQAPNICIAEYPAKTDPVKFLYDGKLDFAIHVNRFKSDEYDSLPLGQIKPTIYSSKQHPIHKLEEISLDDCLAYNFAEILMGEEVPKHFQHPFINALLGHKLQQRVTLKSSQLSILIQMLQKHPLLLIGSDFLFNSEDIKELITPVFQLQQTKKERLEIFLVSHKRIRDSEAHQWIKQQFISSMREQSF